MSTLLVFTGGDAAVVRGVRADRGHGMGHLSPFPCLVACPNEPPLRWHQSLVKLVLVSDLPQAQMTRLIHPDRHCSALMGG